MHGVNFCQSKGSYEEKFRTCMDYKSNAWKSLMTINMLKKCRLTCIVHVLWNPYSANCLSFVYTCTCMIVHMQYLLKGECKLWSLWVNWLNCVFQVTEFPEQNGFGLKNIIGNVWEWTQDWWETKFTPTPKKNPVSVTY